MLNTNFLFRRTLFSTLYTGSIGTRKSFVKFKQKFLVEFYDPFLIFVKINCAKKKKKNTNIYIPNIFSHIAGPNKKKKKIRVTRIELGSPARESHRLLVHLFILSKTDNSS